jgi:hypothetical protein
VQSSLWCEIDFCWWGRQPAQHLCSASGLRNSVLNQIISRCDICILGRVHINVAFAFAIAFIAKACVVKKLLYIVIFGNFIKITNKISAWAQKWRENWTPKQTVFNIGTHGVCELCQYHLSCKTGVMNLNCLYLRESELRAMTFTLFLHVIISDDLYNNELCNFVRLNFRWWIPYVIWWKLIFKNGFCLIFMFLTTLMKLNKFNILMIFTVQKMCRPQNIICIIFCGMLSIAVY